MEDSQPRCRLYLITPSEFELGSFLPKLREAFSGGDIACLQLRMKSAKEEEIIAAAQMLMPICHENNAVFIINDYPNIAQLVGADGIHLGDEDMSVAEARAILGEKAIIGASCYGSRDRAMDAGGDGADYVAFGQFYETQTKPAKGHPTPEILEWWTQTTLLPCVAIGGIKPDNCAPLVQAGADFIAVVTGVWEHPDGVKEAVRQYNKAIELALNQRN